MFPTQYQISAFIRKMALNAAERSQHADAAFFYRQWAVNRECGYPLSAPSALIAQVAANYELAAAEERA